jgi:hypothetical protein
LLAALPFTWPLAAQFLTSVACSHALFDPHLQAFLLGWDWNALTREPWRLFDPPIFHPESLTLTYMDHLLGETVAAAPVFLATGSVAAAYNFVFVLSFVASGWSMYRLVRLVEVPRFGATVCGFLFAFAPYRFANLDLLNQLQTQFLPLGLFFAIRYMQRRRVKDATGVAATITLQAFFGWYYAYYLGLSLCALLLWGVMWRRSFAPRGNPAGIAIAFALGAIPVIAVGVPYAAQRIAMPEFQRTLGEAALYSADLFDYVRWPTNNVIANILRLPSGPQSYWPGLVVVCLAIPAVWAVSKRTGQRAKSASAAPLRFGWSLEAGSRVATQNWIEGYFVFLGVVSFLLSLGPVLKVGGHATSIPLPYAILHLIIPGASGMRTPARLAVLVLLAATVLAGIGYRILTRCPNGGSRTKCRLLAFASAAIALLTVWPEPLSLHELPTPRSMPPVYRWLASRSDGLPILEIPVPRSERDEKEVDARRQFLILFHKHPRLDGVSGYTSLRYRSFRSKLAGFPSREALDASAELGAEWIVMHFADYTPEEARALRGKIDAEPRLRLVSRFDGDALFRLVSAAPSDPADAVGDRPRTSRGRRALGGAYQSP